MKTGLTIQELATEIRRQAEVKEDYRVRTQEIEPLIPLVDMTAANTSFDRDEFALAIPHYGSFSLNDHAHGQIATHLGIPAKYYDKMVAEAPALWQQNVRHWLEESDPEGQRMIRTLDGTARAFVSNRYLPLDNEQLAEAVFPVLAERNVQVVSADITEKKLYIKFVDPSLQMNVEWGSGHAFKRFDDEITWGGVITNSEVGAGSLSVSTMFVRAVCSNTMIVGTDFRKKHVGGSGSAIAGGSDRYIKDDTRAAKDRATFLELRDTVNGVLSETVMEATVRKLEGATTRMLGTKPQESVEKVVKQIGLTKDEGESVLSHLITGGDLSAWGLANAVTRTAEDSPSYDRATELEAAGMSVIDLTDNQWRTIAA